jgi:hypothetical protein
VGASACSSKVLHLVIGGLCEVLVPEPDPQERLRGLGAHDFIHMQPKLSAAVAGGRRYRDHHPCRSKVSQRRSSGPYRGAGRQTVVHEDRAAPLQSSGGRCRR